MFPFALVRGDKMIAIKVRLVAVLCAAAATMPTQGLAQSRQSSSALLPAAPAMLDTSTVPIRAERFAVELGRARQDARSLPAIQRLVAPARNMRPVDKLAFVQSAVTRQVKWMSDTTLWNRHDYWATAAETLGKGAGDMEDRAIVKLQALRALGFGPEELFLTMARDRVGGPMTVLTARVGDRYYILDDSGAAPFDSEKRRREFNPLMSFGLAGAWMHVGKTLINSVRVAAAGK
jgi:predicted transglutaminase-like cysteine proteinase